MRSFRKEWRIRSKQIIATAFIGSLLLGNCLSVSAAEEWAWASPTKGTANTTALTGENTSTIQGTATSNTTVIINELLPNPSASGDEGKEFVELYNYGTKEVDLTNWYFQDKSGKKSSLTELGIIPPTSWRVIFGTFSLNNTTAETITLFSPDKIERDTLSYQKQDVEKGVSLSRFCDVYELLFCTLEKTSPTPGVANIRPQLKAWADPASGEVLPNTEVILHASSPDAKIVYTLKPNSAKTDDSFLYTEPLRIDHPMTLYFYALDEHGATAIEKVTYSLKKVPVQENLTSVVINELMINPVGADDEEWLELKNTGKEKVDLSGAMLIVGEVAKGCDIEKNCYRVPDGTTMYPGKFLVVSAFGTGFSNKKGSVSFVDNGMNVLDIAQYTTKSSVLTRDKAYARVTNSGSVLAQWRNISYRGSDQKFVWTDFPTKGDENILLSIKSPLTDPDGDTLTSSEEEVLGTDPEAFDTNFDGLPDFIDRGSYFSEDERDAEEFQYRSLLTDLFVASVKGTGKTRELVGKTLPKGFVRIFDNDDQILGSTTSDSSGKFSWKFTIMPKTARSFLLTVTDQGNVSSFYSRPVSYISSTVSGMLLPQAKEKKIITTAKTKKKSSAAAQRKSTAKKKVPTIKNASTDIQSLVRALPSIVQVAKEETAAVISGYDEQLLADIKENKIEHALTEAEVEQPQNSSNALWAILGSMLTTMSGFVFWKL